MKNIFLPLLFICLASTVVNAQICCQTSVTTGTTVTYSYTPGGYVMSPYWQLSNNYGSIISQYQVGSEYRVDISWHTAGSETLAFLDGGNYLGSLNINITQGLPPAPVASAATSIAATSFTANCSYVASATSYRLDVSTSSSFTTFVGVYNNYSASGNVQSVTGLAGGTTYYYRMRSQNAAGVSGNSGTITVLTLPPAPTAIAATSMTPSSFTANWNATTSATSYRVDVATDAGFTSILPGYNNYSVSTTNLSVTGLSEGTNYYYRVRAVNATGTSGSSNTISTQTTVTPPVATAGTSVTINSFTANWGAVSGATGYRLDVSDNSGFTPLLGSYTNLAVGGTSQSVTGLLAGTTYYFRVRAEKGSVTSPNSNTITVLTLPAAPTASAATGFSTTAFTANWGSVTSATSYQLDVSTVSNFTSFVTGYNNLSVAGTNSSVSGLAAGITYYYRVRGVNATGASASSSTITTITISAAPATSAATVIGTNTFTANWSAATGAASYRLDVSTLITFTSFVSGYNNLTVAGTSSVVSGLGGNTTYYYRVRAVNASGTSSNSSTITTLTAPVIPTASAATQVAVASFYANWGSAAGATSYRLDVSTSSGFSGFITGYNNLTVATAGKSVTGLTQKTLYYYRVRACNSAGCSASSNVISVDIPDQNYVVTTIIQKENITNSTEINNASIGEKVVITSYLDGLGRPMQTVNMKGSPGLLDVVQPVVYDVYGREAKKYLPITVYDDGWYKPNEQIIDAATGNYIGVAQTFYSTSTDNIADDTRPYSETVFEASPLSRPDKDFGAGADWYNNNKYIKHGYLVNVHGTAAGEEKIIAWEVSGNEPVRAAVVANYTVTGGYYATGQVNVKSTKDEQGNEVREYTDKSGRVILKKVQSVATPTLSNRDHWAQTYYVYDINGNLRFVLPPELTYLVYFDDTTNPGPTNLDNWAFQYTYDQRNRMVTKKVPGAGVVYMVYDKRDRLVLTQDANQRGSNNWTFTKYDVLNRPVLTGIYTDATNITLTLMQAAVDNYYNNLTASQAWYETYTGSGVHGYNNYSFPQVTAVNNYLTVTYYDSYDFRSLWYGTYTYLNDSLSNGVNYSQPTTENVRVVGQVTGTKTKVLDGGTTGGYTWLKSVNYYDDKYRVVQTLADNYKGGTDRTTHVIDFTGKVLKSKSTHTENDVAWKDLVGSTLLGNRLYRTATSNNWTGSGAVSVQQLAAGQSGWMEVVVSEVSTNRMIGLADTNPNVNYTSIDYAFYLNTNALKIYENGTLKASISGTLVPGEVLRIERSGTTVQYKRNGTVVYTSATTSSSILFVDASLNTYNAAPLSSASLVGVRTSFPGNTRTITRRMEYDHAGRLLKTWHKVDANDSILLAFNEYNELGQLVDKKIHSTVSTAANAKQSIDYRYNIRGWLTKMNEANVSALASGDVIKDYFGFELAYNNTDLGIGNTALYNGNISAMAWSNNLSLGSIKQNGYMYDYDALNRIKTSVFKDKNTTTWNTPANSALQETGFNYDRNGNITTLQRNDKRASGWMDNLSYTYTGNQLMRVTDTGDDFAGFLDGQPGTGNDYTYDLNGNMTRDLNKGIGTTLADATNLITYNFLNLPETVTKGTNSIRYIYDATGRKLAQVTTFGGQQKSVDYAGEFQYENDVLQFVSHEEGRIAIAGTQSIYLHSGDAVSGITAATSTLATVTGTNGETYIRATSVGTTAKQGMFPIGGTFTVVAGEKYRIRAKGYSTGANAVYLYIRTNSTDLNWPGAALANGAVAEANAEQIITVPTGHTTLQAGVVWNTVTAGQQFFLNDFEITKLTTNATPEYQYNLKDHLGNVRVTFTATPPPPDVYTATYEDANATSESNTFNPSYSTAVRINSALFNKTAGGTKSQRLSAANSNEIIGLTKSMKVIPGDTIDLQVYAKYSAPTTTNSNVAGLIFGSIQSAFGVSAGSLGDGGLLYQTLSAMNGANALINSGQGINNNAPKAYLNYLLFDDKFMLVDAGFTQVPENALETGGGVPHQLLQLQAVVRESGYVYVYLSNENDKLVDVYFDDLTITHRHGPVIQSDDYYPFGLTFNSYKRENSTENKFLFNKGSELQTDLNLGIYSTPFRMYDPAIGRFLQIDPLKDFFPGISPFNFSFNNPVSFGDPYGLAPIWVLALRAQIKQVWYNITGRKNQTATIIGHHGRDLNGKRKPAVWHAGHNGKEPAKISKAIYPSSKSKDDNDEQPESEIGDLDLVFPEPEDPGLIKNDTKEEPKTKSGYRLFIDNQEIKGNFEIDVNTTLFVDNDSHPIGGPNTLMNYLSPMAEYLRVNPSITIEVILITPVPDGERMKDSNKPAQQVQRERLEAIRDAMGKMGISRQRIYGDYKYNQKNLDHPVTRIKKK